MVKHGYGENACFLHELERIETLKKRKQTFSQIVCQRVELSLTSVAGVCQETNGSSI